ncbi:centromere-associated protein E-like [Macrobrachium nipponense]|uniref:centromere-associated protein E-like n=1 Tax=Macrobrachium nipponense TaxID=159736 RepID=UPI0030C7DA47
MSDNILVAVRLRPLIQREVTDNSAIHWQLGEGNTLIQIDPHTRKALCPPYKFDRVFGMDYENADIFFEVAQGIVESALAGFNGTIFAYGQTSSGKTYTMMGEKSSPGIIPLAIQNIFNSIEKNNPDREYLISAFVNFRDSKLTRILQSSLGGNAKTAIVCNVTPVGIDQTHSTLSTE